MLFRIFFTLLFIFFNLSPIQAQRDDYELFTTREGLPHNNVLSIIQDHYGFIWLGTYNGLCMYDGQDFKHYPEVNLTPKNSWEKVINTLFEDNNHNIWVGGWNGSVSCFVRTRQRFIQYKSPISQAKVNSIYQDNKNNVWIAYENGSIGLVQDDSIHITSVDDVGIWVINQVEDNYLYLVTENGILKYNTSTKATNELKYYKDKQTFDIAIYKNGFYSVNDNGITNVNLKKRIHETHIPYTKNNVSTAYVKIALSRSGNFHVTNGHIIYEYTKDLKLLDSFYVSHNISYDKRTIANRFIEDHSGVLWLATTSGLIKIDKHKKQFSTYNINNTITTLTHNYARSLYIDENNDLWIGYRSGKINKLVYNKINNSYVLADAYSVNTPYNALANTAYTTNTITQTQNGTILYGGEQGVFYLSGKGVFEHILPKDYREKAVQVWGLYEDEQRNLWIGTKNNGLFIYSRHNNKVYQYQHNSKDKNSLSDNDIWKIFVDHKKRIWVGTKNGLDYINNSQDVSRLKFSHHTIESHNIRNVWSMIQDQYNNIWVGTTESGLYKISEDLSNTVRINSLKEQTISAIVIDSINNLWISTINGLYKYTADEKLFFFDESDGLISTDFNFNAATINKRNQVFLGTKLGVITFNPCQIVHREKSNQPVKVSSIQVSGKNYTGKLYKDDMLNLTWQENDIIIDLSLPDYTKYKTQFRYKLIGNHNNWVYLRRNQSRAIYSNIVPGRYRFITQARSNKEKWHHETIFTINIHPAFWQTLWFKTLILLLAVAIAILLTRNRFYSLLRKQKKKIELEKKMAFLELDALRAQMNPHFIFNTINSIQGYIIDNDEVEANKYLINFARLMRLFLESSKKRFILLNDELELIKLYMTLEKLRFDDKFDFKINIEKDVDTTRWYIPSLLLHPIIENAIKHGLAHQKTKGRLLLNIDKIDSVLKISIDDNGIGRKQSTYINSQKKPNHISRGMEMILDRIKTFNFIEELDITIEIVDKVYPDTGTTVILLITMKQAKEIHHD